MATTLYAFTVPPLIRGLSVLSTYMDKAIEHATRHGTSADALFGARLAPDMQPLSSQVQMACDKAKNGVGRLAGVTPPPYSDTETTFDELKARIAKTQAFIQTITAASFEGAGERIIEFRFKGTQMISGHDYLTKVLLPDFYYHIATAHAIFRSNGLQLGKADYLGEIA